MNASIAWRNTTLPEGFFHCMGSQDHVTHPLVSLQLGGEQHEKSYKSFTKMMQWGWDPTGVDFVSSKHLIRLHKKSKNAGVFFLS